MTTFTVSIAAKARAQLRAIRTWWVQHRPDAAGLVQLELEKAVELLREAPLTHRVVEQSSNAEVRRVLLPRARYHVYYVVDMDQRKVQVLSLWHAARGSGPIL